MALGDDGRRSVAQAQDSAHGFGHDYTVGSPHLRHATLRNNIERRITNTIKEILQQRGECAVLEIGAGHGSFTDTVLAAGGTASSTEMSKASAEYLESKFRGNSRVTVIYDPDGQAPFDQPVQYDVILLISVIHHIPDYIDVVSRLCDTVLRPGGTVVTYQDPLWYPRQKRWKRALNWGFYFLWRVTQGELRRGIATRWRRLRGVYSYSNPSDLVEYHVVRQGVDELALQDIFSARFASVELSTYFSTQSPQLQTIGQRCLPPNNFGFVARGRLG